MRPGPEAQLCVSDKTRPHLIRPDQSRPGQTRAGQSRPDPPQAQRLPETHWFHWYPSSCQTAGPEASTVRRALRMRRCWTAPRGKFKKRFKRIQIITTTSTADHVLIPASSTGYHVLISEPYSTGDHVPITASSTGDNVPITESSIVCRPRPDHRVQYSLETTS
ncbi:unnamed protein product [Gadus morhua 'NCC']